MAASLFQKITLNYAPIAPIVIPFGSSSPTGSPHRNLSV